MGRTSFVPVLLVPALAIVSPLSGVPGFSSLAGLTIALVSGQLLVGRKEMWLPDWITRQRVRPDWTERVTRSMTRPARWFDSYTKPRLAFLAVSPFDRVIYVLCMICGLMMPFMEFLPFTSSVIGFAVVMMGLALLVRDGLFALVGYSLIGLLITGVTMLIF